jgi:uncharacterized protein YbbC (DUF1343 family)
MTQNHGGRTYGFDVDTAYSSARGLRFAPGSTFGHTGFTGTMFWVDPVSKCFAVLLTNRVHPDGKGSIIALRKIVMTYVAEALLGPATDQTRVGVDVLEDEDFAPLRGRKVALITNHTGLDRFGRRTIDVLHRSSSVQLVSLMSPEHGLEGKLDEQVGHGRDEKTGLRVWSLYGQSKKPSEEMLNGADTLVFDIQDIGTRFYTYISTMGNAMEFAAPGKLRFVVLDRPNPIAPLGVHGPLADADKLSFTAYKPLPVTHGMTVGELGRLLSGEFGLGVDVEVVTMRHWNHALWWEQTGVPWVNPSPNMRSPLEAALYPGVGLLEFTNVSVGRGTDEPFERVGAPWIKGDTLAAALNATKLPGVKFTAESFVPSASKFAKQRCGGVRISVTDRAALQPVRLGVTIAATLHTQYGQQFEAEKVLKLLASDKAQAAWMSGDTSGAAWKEDVAHFEQLRAKYLLYP